MKKTKLRLAATLFAVMLSVTAFSMPAFAYSQEPVTDGTPAKTSTPETGTASTDATAGKDGSSTAALTPNGNLSLVDDVETSDSSSKQFITLQSKNGNYFYLVIDRSGDKENVYFLNLVDEADLMALIDDKDASKDTVKSCTCDTKCTAGNVDTTCPVCKDDMTKCTGKEKTVETTTTPAEAASSSTTETPNSSNKTSSIFMVVACLLVLAGGGIVYFLKFRKEKPKTKGSTDLDDYDYGDEEDEPEEQDDAEKSDDASAPDTDAEKEVDSE